VLVPRLRVRLRSTFVASLRPTRGIANPLASLAQCVGNGLWNLAVAGQTFYVLVLHRTTSPHAKWLVSISIVIFQVLTVSIGPILNAREGSPYPFYGPNPAGCYATVGARSWQLWLRFGPMVALVCLASITALYATILVKVRLLHDLKLRDTATG